MIDVLRKIGTYLWNTLESVAFAIGVLVVCYTFLFQTAEVVGASSYPTLKNGERYIVDKISYRFEKPRRGDFVVIKSPNNHNVDFIKRIVGLPGESIALRACRVYIGNQLLPEPYLDPGICTGPEAYLGENQLLHIPSNSYFLMGDNREHSSDSREFGPVSMENIVGKFVLRWWPPDRFNPSPK